MTSVKEYRQLQETLHIHQLPNGLVVYVLPKKDFQKTYAVFSTHFGSIDNHFRIQGNEIRVPDGVAHFLEHKMFEEPEGDVFARFASQGASANAFTGFEQTSYLFSATKEISANLATLLDFVQNPYFTEKNVEKEKGIIGQEIQMYQDNPDWRSYFGLIEAMYSVHPIHIDIAGTIDSIQRINPDVLNECYHTFYHPGNMNLFVVGGVEPEEIINWVTDNQAAKTFQPQRKAERILATEPTKIKEAMKVIYLPVSLPKCLLGFKEEHPQLNGGATLYKECLTKLALDILFSPSSEIYQTLYDEGLISDQFSHEYNLSEQYAFSVIGGDTRDPELLLIRIKEQVSAILAKGIDSASFERSRKKKIGNFLRMMNSPETIAHEFIRHQMKGWDLFDMIHTYENMTCEEVNIRLRQHFNWRQMAVSIVRSSDQ